MKRIPFQNRSIWIIFVFGYLVFVIFISCVGRKKPDDIALIKNLLNEFSYGINEKNTALLDSLYSGDKEEKASSISKLLQDLSNLGEVKNVGFLGKRIEIFGKDATVNVTLKGEKMEGTNVVEFSVPMELKLVKKRQGWRIVEHRFPEGS